MWGLATGWLLGLVLGARHAFEPDHLAAVSTLVAGERAGGRRAALTGAIWGIGHTASLLAVGSVLFVVRARVPGRLDDSFELAVCGMLIALGLRTLSRRRVSPHAHPGVRGRRPLAVGLLHGLAGSGALAALALALMPSFGAALLYTLWFGAGAMIGMAGLAAVGGWALGRLEADGRAQSLLIGVAGALSLVLGIVRSLPLALRLLRG